MSLALSDFQIPPPENEEKFENLCLDLYKAKFGDKTQKNGRRGQSQNGVDIIFSQYEESEGSIVTIGIQCKKREHLKRKITEQELREEVEKALVFQLSYPFFM